VSSPLHFTKPKIKKEISNIDQYIEDNVDVLKAGRKRVSMSPIKFYNEEKYQTHLIKEKKNSIKLKWHGTQQILLIFSPNIRNLKSHDLSLSFPPPKRITHHI